MLSTGMVKANEDLPGSAWSIVIFPEKSLNRPWMLLIPWWEIMNEMDEWTGSTWYVSAARAALPQVTRIVARASCRNAAAVIGAPLRGRRVQCGSIITRRRGQLHHLWVVGGPTRATWPDSIGQKKREERG